LKVYSSKQVMENDKTVEDNNSISSNNDVQIETNSYEEERQILLNRYVMHADLNELFLLLQKFIQNIMPIFFCRINHELKRMSHKIALVNTNMSAMGKQSAQLSQVAKVWKDAFSSVPTSEGQESMDTASNKSSA